jgi:hypothetical protein
MNRRIPIIRKTWMVWVRNRGQERFSSRFKASNVFTKTISFNPLIPYIANQGQEDIVPGCHVPGFLKQEFKEGIPVEKHLKIRSRLVTSNQIHAYYFPRSILN